MNQRSVALTKVCAAVALACVLLSASLAQEAKPQEAAPFDQAAALAELRKQIAGREREPSGQVFKNVQLLKDVPAGRLLRVMEIGYGRSLGVDCTHCHVAGQWDKEDKTEKQVSREMITWTRTMNDELKKIKGLKSAMPAVNCTTCHRGQKKPALDLPAPGKAQ